MTKYRLTPAPSSLPQSHLTDWTSSNSQPKHLALLEESTLLPQLLTGNNGPVFPQLANSPSLDQAQSTALWPLRYQVKTHTTTQS